MTRTRHSVGASTLVLAIATFGLAVVPAFGATFYEYSISASSADPRENTGDLPVGVPGAVYLWLECTSIDGMSALEMGVEVTGLLLLSFTPLNGVLNAGTAESPLLAVGGCPYGPFLLGAIGVLNLGSGGQVCLGPSPANDWFVTVDCDPIDPQVHECGVRGFSTPGGFYCDNANCPPGSVDSRHWSAVKVLYR
ncbi:MAG: hypothetical protein KC591_01700 [Gemmatimonadetes bacterium]|nr:hypothetical protein [Gemmatimonadota bacterium]